MTEHVENMRGMELAREKAHNKRKKMIKRQKDLIKARDVDNSGKNSPDSRNEICDAKVRGLITHEFSY
jgi:hypothetical protein